MTQVPDELVAGKYRVTRLIGRGGMGSVWEGIHLTLGTRVAVKFVDGAAAESPEGLQRFENEARAAARLNSKYAVQVYDHGTLQDGRPFIVMEFLTGEPLDKRLDRENRISAAETARIIHQVCRALSRAHATGIVHRDLKPENVFLVWDEEDQANVAKVVDFGIAKFTNGPAGISSSTRTGSLLGTPYFMSPEQARGLRTVDYRTDLWSLGVIAYRCIVGKLPFEGVSVGDLLVKICTAPVPVPSQEFEDCPPGFDAWFARAMQREPSERFASAQELAEQLSVICGGPRASMSSGPFSGARASAVNEWSSSAHGGEVRAATVPGERHPSAGGAFTRTATGLTVNRNWLVLGSVALTGLGVALGLFLLGGGSGRSIEPAKQGAAVASGNAPQVVPAIAPSVSVPKAQNLDANIAVEPVLVPPPVASQVKGETAPDVSEASSGTPFSGSTRAPGQIAGGVRGGRSAAGTAPGTRNNRTGSAAGQQPIELGY